jgi:SHS2 domain-containing protein
MNTLIDTKIKEYDEKFYHEETIDHEPCEVLVSNKDGKCNCQLSDIRDFLHSSLQDIEKQTREEEAKAYAKGLKIICEKYPSLATEIKAILYDELKEKK